MFERIVPPLLVGLAILIPTAVTGAFALAFAQDGPHYRQELHARTSSLEEMRRATPTTPPRGVVEPLRGPWVVALQPGHWQIEDLPSEHDHRRRGPGAVFGSLREIDVNLPVVDALVPLLEAEGWTVLVVPATVPPGLRADAFLSVHADWAGDPNRRGWKLAPPWRPSPAARALADALSAEFADTLPHDRDGVTGGMRGYFGFASHRYEHASSPFTPAVLVELGFLTNRSDRDRLTTDPDFYAAILHRGLKRYFANRDRDDAESLRPQQFGVYTARATGAAVRVRPDPGAAVLRTVEPGQLFRPVDRRGEWLEVRVREPRRMAWIHRSAVTVISQDGWWLPVRSGLHAYGP